MAKEPKKPPKKEPKKHGTGIYRSHPKKSPAKSCGYCHGAGCRKCGGTGYPR